jgi:hypothetical protein
MYGAKCKKVENDTEGKRNTIKSIECLFHYGIYFFYFLKC